MMWNCFLLHSKEIFYNQYNSVTMVTKYFNIRFFFQAKCKYLDALANLEIFGVLLEARIHNFLHPWFKSRLGNTVLSPQIDEVPSSCAHVRFLAV